MLDRSGPVRRRLVLSLPSAGDRGEGSVSHIAVILLVAIVTGALVTSVLPAQVTDRIGAAVCRVSGEDCEPGRSTASNPDDPGGSGERGEPGEHGERRQPGAPDVDFTKASDKEDEEDKNTYPLPGQQAVALVHEANHVDALYTSRTVNFLSEVLSRDEYVDGMLREEAEGSALMVQAAGKLRLQGVEIPPFQTIYKDSYDRAVRAAEKENEDRGRPPMSEPDRHEIGKRAGTDALLDEYRHNSGYPQKFGSHWDRINAPAP